MHILNLCQLRPKETCHPLGFQMKKVLVNTYYNVLKQRLSHYAN